MTELVDIDDITPDETFLSDVRKTRVTTPVTRVLIALVVVAAAFLGGAVLARWQQEAPAASNAQSLISQIRAAAGGSGAQGAAGGGPAGLPGGRGGASPAGGATFGTVKLVDGSNVYVEDAQGNVVKITTNPSTAVSVTKTGKVNDLAPGSTVIVQGTQSADGLSMSATAISQSTGFGGGGGFPRGAAG